MLVPIKHIVCALPLTLTFGTASSSCQSPPHRLTDSHASQLLFAFGLVFFPVHAPTSTSGSFSHAETLLWAPQSATGSGILDDMAHRTAML